jgi:hypothetical protein
MLDDNIGQKSCNRPPSPALVSPSDSKHWFHRFFQLASAPETQQQHKHQLAEKFVTSLAEHSNPKVLGYLDVADQRIIVVVNADAAVEPRSRVHLVQPEPAINQTTHNRPQPGHYSPFEIVVRYTLLVWIPNSIAIFIFESFARDEYTARLLPSNRPRQPTTQQLHLARPVAEPDDTWQH